jgi:hypothetical protein
MQLTDNTRALALAGMAQAGINLLRPDRVRLRTVYRLLSYVMWLVIFFFIASWELDRHPADGW